MEEQFKTLAELFRRAHVVFSGIKTYNVMAADIVREVHKEVSGLMAKEGDPEQVVIPQRLISQLLKLCVAMKDYRHATSQGDDMKQMTYRRAVVEVEVDRMKQFVLDWADGKLL